MPQSLLRTLETLNKETIKTVEGNSEIKLFEEKKVRTLWDAQREAWYISVIDVIEVLTETDRPRKYWNDLKTKLKKEGSQLSEKIGQLKMQSSDGKYYQTDVADTEQIFRLIQSIPSPKAVVARAAWQRASGRNAGPGNYN